MQDVFQVIVTTLTEGSAIALIALGINIIFATTRIVNFAQGGVVVAAGYVAFLVTSPAKGIGLGVWLALGVVCVVGVVLGLFIDVWGVSALGGFSASENPGWLIMTISMVVLVPVWALQEKPFMPLTYLAIAGLVIGLVLGLVKASPLGKFDPSTNVGWIITTFALGTLFVPNVVSKTISTSPEKIPDLIEGVAFKPFGVPVTWGDLLVIAFSVAIMVGLELLLGRTMLGRAFHAVQQDRVTASLMGINTGRVVIVSFAIAGMLGAIAAVLIAPKFFVKPENSIILSFTALVAAVFGGLGSTRGAVVGAFVAAFIKAAVQAFPDGDKYWQPALFLVLLLVLRVRPSGLFGRVAVEKV